jgi:hypothetical protein
MGERPPTSCPDSKGGHMARSVASGSRERLPDGDHARLKAFGAPVLSVMRSFPGSIRP